MHVDLHDLTTTVQMEDKSKVVMEATSGLFDTKSQILDLKDSIFLRSSTGYEARLTQARVDMAKGTVTSDQHVDVKLTNGTLSSDRLRISGGGDDVFFEGHVVMHLDKLPASDPPAEAATASAESAPPEAAPVPVHPAKARSASHKSAKPK